MGDNGTKTKILDAAENLFTTKGFSGTSLRAIIKKAGVNTASIHYHFGSKEGLIEAVVNRLVTPLNDERIELLDELESRYPSGPLPLENVIEAFLNPIFRPRRSAPKKRLLFLGLLARTITEPTQDVIEMFHNIFGEILRRFTAAFTRALPELSAKELQWRILFMVGAMAHTLMSPLSQAKNTDVGLDFRDTDRVDRFLIDFVAAGMRVPANETIRKDNP